MLSGVGCDLGGTFFCRGAEGQGEELSICTSCTRSFVRVISDRSRAFQPPGQLSSAQAAQESDCKSTLVLSMQLHEWPSWLHHAAPVQPVTCFPGIDRSQANCHLAWLACSAAIACFQVLNTAASSVLNSLAMLWHNHMYHVQYRSSVPQVRATRTNACTQTPTKAMCHSTQSQFIQCAHSL